jgi:plastocyanin
VVVVVGAAVPLGLAACSPTPANLGHGPLGISQANRAAAAVITINNTGFSPSVTYVQAGLNILVINASYESHTVTAFDGAFGTGVLAGGGDDASFVIKTPGTYRYYDELNPGTLQGEIVVTPAS